MCCIFQHMMRTRLNVHCLRIPETVVDLIIRLEVAYDLDVNIFVLNGNGRNLIRIRRSKGRGERDPELLCRIGEILFARNDASVPPAE